MKVRTRTRPGQRELDSQFKVAGQVGDAVGGGDDVSVADEGAAALELHVRAARDDVAEIGQPRILTDVRVLGRFPNRELVKFGIFLPLKYFDPFSGIALC